MRDDPILIVDSDEQCRDDLVGLVSRLGRPAATATDSGSALAILESVMPAMIVMDLETGGLELCRELLDRSKGRVPLILLSSRRTEPGDRVAGLLVGADDYLAKPFDDGELLARMRRSFSRTTRTMTADPATPLSRREWEVLELVATGANHKQIARQLVISVKTVSSHVQHILAKLGVHSSAQAVAYAVNSGLGTVARVGTAPERARPTPP